MKQNPEGNEIIADAEQMARIMSEVVVTLPPQAQFGFFQQIIGAAALAQMMEEQKPA